jgi:hypothetical protein
MQKIKQKSIQFGHYARNDPFNIGRRSKPRQKNSGQALWFLHRPLGASQFPKVYYGNANHDATFRATIPFIPKLYPLFDKNQGAHGCLPVNYALWKRLLEKISDLR